MSAIETERALREAVFHAIAAPALILGPDRRVRAANAAAQRVSPNVPVEPRVSLAQWLTAAGFSCDAALDDAIGRAFEGATEVVSLGGRGASVTLCPVLVAQRVFGLCATLSLCPTPAADAPPDDGVVRFTWNPDTDALTLAGAVRAVLGPSHEGPGQTLQGFLIRIGTDDAVGLQSRLREALARGGCAPSEFRVRGEDGRARVILCTAVASQRPGEPACARGTFTDVTALASQRQRESDARKHEALARLAGGVVHDFNHLVALVSACALALKDVVPEGQRGRAEVMDLGVASKRAADLVRQMLTFARKQRVARSVQAVPAMLDRVMPTLRRLVPATMDLDVSVADGTPTIAVDARQFEQALMALVVNAREATRGAGAVSIRARPVREGDREWMELSVRDDGPGMTRDVQERVFEPYFSTRSEGRGAGLASVDSILRAVAGEVRVESEPGQGTTVTLRVPSSQQADPIGGRRRGVTPRPVGPAAGLELLSVMVVEDDDAQRRAVLASLRSAGVRAVEADGLSQAMARCPARLDVLLTAARMREASGAEVAAAVRARQPSVQVVFLVGAQEGAEADLAPALQKPFTTGELLAKLRATPAE